MCDTDQFSAFAWIRKNKKHKNKFIGFLFKFAKINRRKNIQIYGREKRLDLDQFCHTNILAHKLAMTALTITDLVHCLVVE